MAMMMETKMILAHPSAYTAGWDYFTSGLNEYESLSCRVCHARLLVKRGAVGPTSWAHAILIKAGRAQPKEHDAFYCSHTGKAWHQRVLALRKESADTASRPIAAILTAEADQISAAATSN